jgi:hypothetical protein
MSTIRKLDPTVRIDRFLRKHALRELQGDVKLARKKIEQGRTLLETAPTDDMRAQVKEHMTSLLRFQVISEMTLQHLTKVHRDPRRTGAAKEAIFAKIGGPK